jgi:cellulose synthase/poly-beta-1,6-N-acetylglucosamine synthase-like glycosyltransferase
MISVVIPAYNAEKTLATCLQALHQQSFPADEVIVVDDGSSDNTAQVARREGALVISQPNQGPAAARNTGINACHGDLVLFTDSDCVPEGTWVERMARPLVAGVDGVKGAYRTRQTQPVARLVQCEFEERYELLKRHQYIDFVDGHAAAFRIAAVQEVGCFDPGLTENEDVDLSYRLSAAGKRMVFAPDAVVYHSHPHSYSSYFRLKTGRGYWRMLVYRSHPGKAVRDSYTPQMLKVQILLVYLTFGSLLLTLLNPLFWAGVAIFVASFLLTTVPFVRLVRRFAPDLVLAAPWFILVRAVAFSFGILAGLAAMFLFRPQINSRPAR